MTLHGLVDYALILEVLENKKGWIIKIKLLKELHMTTERMIDIHKFDINHFLYIQ